MLVLSRRVHEAVLFPGFDATVRVLSASNGVIRLGIDAPHEVAIVREELHPGPPLREARPGRTLPRLARQLRDRLRKTAVGLGLTQLLLDAGRPEDAGRSLAAVRDDLQVLRRALDGELEADRPVPSAAPKPPARALLVEDDRNQRELLAGFLRLAGLEVDTAGDGCDALEYLHSRPRPDVVLMDMGLPRCDGATAVRHIRRDPALAGLRIFAVTGSPPERFGLARGPGGIDRWFQKPIDPACLLQELTAAPCHA
jgi:carbon storage regulator CsrA